MKLNGEVDLIYEDSKVLVVRDPGSKTFYSVIPEATADDLWSRFEAAEAAFRALPIQDESEAICSFFEYIATLLITSSDAKARFMAAGGETDPEKREVWAKVVNAIESLERLKTFHN